jgi:methionyl-tRNA formyltransferase
MDRIKVVFFGTPQFAVPSLQRLLSHGDFEVLAVVTQPDRRRGRGGKAEPSPVKAVAQAAGCLVFQPERIKKDADTLSRLKALSADAFVVVAYGQILSPEILEMPRLGCVNAHGSILPKYRGAAPIQWCLYEGASVTGVTTMQMDAGMDTGPMLMSETIPIGLLDNAWQIAEKLSQLSAALLLTTLQKRQQQMILPVPQNDEQATYAPLIKKGDYSLDWQKSAEALHNQVRGFYPNCVSAFRESPLKITATVPLGDRYWQQLPSEFAQTLQPLYASAEIAPNALPGTVVGLLKNYGPVIQAGSDRLLLTAVKPAGKKAVSGWEFVNGSRVEVGERLGSALQN